MADNVAVTAGSGTTIAADEVVHGTLGTVKVQYVKLMDGTIDGTGGCSVLARGLHVEEHVLSVFSTTNFTRPADTTAYASGDLVANSTAAGSVTLLTFAGIARASGISGRVKGARLMKSTNAVTNAAFRLHLFDTIPTVTSAGDNSALTSVIQVTGKGYIGYIDLPTAVGFQDVSWSSGNPDNTRASLHFVPVATSLFGVLEARGAYTPGNAEVFTIGIWVEED